MKNLKKVISLVLVVAMLASFAGMTGFTPSIIAMAASNIVVDMPSSLYKAAGYAYTYTSGGVQYTSPTTDYVIPTDQDASLTVTFPEGTYYFQGQLSVDGENFYGIWGTVSRTSFPYGTTAAQITRSTPQISDYLPCDLYNSHLKGNGGYAAYDKVYWRFIAMDENKVQFDSIVVEVELVLKPNTTSSKPADSKSGINQATIDMPPVLYTNSNGEITKSISSSSATTTLDTVLKIWTPDTATSATLSVVSYDSDGDVYKTYSTFDMYKSTADGKHYLEVDFAGETATNLTNGNPWLILRLDYVVPSVTHTPYNTSTGNVLDSTYDEAVALGKSAYLDNTYNGDGSKSVSDTVDVTYTQYIAAYVTSLPTYYQAGWQFDLGTKYSGAEQSLAGVIMLDMAPALAADGINLYGSLRVDDSDDYADAALRNYLESKTDLGLSTTQNNALIWYNKEQKTSCGDNNGVYTSGNFSSSGANSSTRTMGGTIYYDSTVTSSVPVNIKYDFTSSSYNCDDNSLEGFWLTWYNSGVTRAGYDYILDGSSATAYSYVSGLTSHANSNAGTASTSYSSNGYTVFTTSGTHPSSSMNFQSSDVTTYFTFNLANATASGNPYWRCALQINRPTYSTWGMKTNLRTIFGFHLDAIAVDRAAEHTVINAAISKNFVEAEMDEAWWKAYREEVLFAYYDCGDLRNTVGVEGLFDTCIADGYATDAPVYKTANFAELEAAILNTPAYDRGTSQKDSNITGTLPVGSNFYDVVKYLDGEAQASDPANGATYYNNDTAGNGVTNITNSAMYRYSGAYFYTESSWKTYATERYYALNIRKYPSTNIEVFWYGAGYMTGDAGTFCYTYLQSYIDAAYERLATAYNNLQLRTLAELKMRNDKSSTKDYDGDGVADNVTAGGGAWVYFDKEVTYNGKTYAAGTQVIGYDAIMAYLTSLIPTDTYWYYSSVTTDSNGFATGLAKIENQLVYDTTALEALLSQMQTIFAEDQTVVDMGIKFEEYIENFLALVEITKNNPVSSNDDGWTAIFKYINDTLCGDLGPAGGLDDENFVTEISKIYTLTDAQKTNFTTLIKEYTTAFAANTTADKQEAINTATINFFEALKAAFPSIQVSTAITNAGNVPKADGSTYQVYAPEQSTNKENSIYDSNSVAELEAALSAATAANASGYVFKDTTWQSLVDRYNEIVGWATVYSETNTDGKLVYAKVDTTSLKIALQAAQAALAEDNLTTTVTSPDGNTTVTHDLYTAQSVAELQYIIDEAQKVDENQLYTSQLSIDLLTFALYDEWDDNKVLLAFNTDQAARKWSYDESGNPTGYTNQWMDAIAEIYLYGVRAEGATGSDEGLEFNTAYYGFLDAEIIAQRDDDSDHVWNDDGSLKMTTVTSSDGITQQVPAGSTVYNSETWGAYYAALTAAKELSRSYTASDADQAVVDAAAKKVYDTRAALKLNYFPSNKDAFATAQGWYANLEAYLVTTPITRYGYTIDTETGELVEATALDSCNENINIYNNITPEFENALLSFKAKYASESSTEPFNSLAAAQALYDSIIADYVNSATAPIELKAADDPSLRAGAEDLVENYIAGTPDFVTALLKSGAYEAGGYDSDLIAKTDSDWDGSAWRQGSQGYTIDDYLKKIYAKFSTENVVSSTFGETLKDFTDDLYRYTTTTNAYDLQFATYMRDNELYPFLDYSYTGDVPYYYDDDNDGLGEYTYKLFDETVVNQIKASVDSYFVVSGDTINLDNATKWPLIYQVNGLTWNKEAVNEEGAYVEAAVDGYEYTDSAYTGTYDSICNILNAVASHSTNYTYAVKFGVNSFNTTPYFWLIDNAFKADGDVEYILGDASAVRADTTVAPFNYDVSFESGFWYSAGYGVDGGKYYLYDNPGASGFQKSWFIDENGAMTIIATYRSDEMAQVFGQTTLKSLKNLSPVSYYNNIFVAGSEGFLEFMDDLTQNGWTKEGFEIFGSFVIAGQSQLDGIATDMYNQIQSLQLRTATEAYRDVYLTYLGVKGSTATFSEENYKDYVGTETTNGVDYYTFYNLNEDTFLNQFTGETLYDSAVPPYGTVSKSDVKLWDNYKDEGKEQLEAFILELIQGTVTVDKAELVNGYNPGDGVETDMEKLIAILSTLELKDRNTSWLDALVEAFLTDNLSSLTSDTTITLFSQFPSGALEIVSSNGDFYTSEYYTEESLIALAQKMQAANAIQNVVTYNTTTGKYKLLIDLGVTDISPYKGSMYTNATQDELNEYVEYTLLPAIRNDLVLAPASTTSIDTVLEGGATAAYNNPNLYVANDAWDAFVVAYKAAVAAKDNCVVNVDGSYYTKLNDQETVNQFATKLADALKDIVNKADSAAPKMTVSINDSAVSDFYTSSVKVDNNDENSETNADRIAKVDSTGAEKPVTGTFFMPDNGGYSLLVYTNEVSPRIVLEIEDVEDANGIEATKHEVLSVKSSRSSGTTTELIYGTKNGRGAITEIISRNLKKDAENPDTTGPLEKYENTTKASAGSTKNEEGSSLFAVLAPTFAANSNGIAVAIYSISVNDAAASGENVADGTEDNYTSSLVIGEKDVDVTTSKDNEVTVYIYYHNSMNDVTDEGITVAEDGTVALAAPSKGADHVASVLFSNEIGYAGAWKNSIRLHRQFSSNIRSWEFMSEITDNKVGNVENVTYNDPNFGDKNLGSFYYVLDEESDADIYATYAESKDATDGVMDYDRATVAKEAMKTKISEMTAEAITAFKKSDNFHVYGAVDENDNYVNYIQHLTDITENGDLVFVHVVDRWGNVVNRIIEITRVDKTAPALTPDSSAHTLTIVEEGGSGLTGIQISNSSYSEGGVDLSNYSISESTGQNVTKRENGSMQVECAGTTLQISGLTAGRSYYFAVTDKAGNLSGANVTADASGNITIKIDTNIVIPESDEEIVTNAITLNGTDTIILNAGEASSIIDASLEGNVFANRTIRHFVTTYDNVTQLKTVYQDGTVEEWTSDNAYLTDNGDGTLTWVIPRKLAEGEHSYKVYAMVDGEYETFYAPATITATSRTVTLTYMVAGMGRMILKYSGSAEVKNSSYKSTVIPYGAKVTITAENNTEGCDFYYWINNYTNRIISVAETYEFTAVTNINCSAQFTSCESYYEAKKLVVYVNNAKNVVEAFELAEGETYTVPAGPVLPDYTFKGWSMTKEEVLASDKDTVIVEPVYTLSAVNTVTITEGNYTATGAGTYTAEDNQRAVVTISTSATDDDGNEFLYWLDDDTDEIVSYDRTYSFFCVKDTVLTPVYGDASTVTAAPIVRITEVRYSALSGKVSFFAERSIPEEFTLLQTGIVVTKTESIGTNDEVFVVGGTSTAAGTSTSTANNGYYSASTAISTGQTVWARAYAIYETADGEILEAYGPVTSYTVE